MASKEHEVIARALLMVLKEMGGAETAPKEPTSDELCQQLYRASQEPGAFAKRLAQWRTRREEEGGDSGDRSGHGSSYTPPRPGSRKRRAQ